MQVRARYLALGLVLGATPAIAETPQREVLRKDWHRCLRQSFSGQPTSLGQKAAEHAALAACKPAEDAYVAAELDAQLAEDEGTRRERRSLTARARAMLASVTSYVVEPVTSWFGAFGR